MYTLHKNSPPPRQRHQELLVSRIVVRFAPAGLCRIAAAFAVGLAPVGLARAQSMALAGAPTPDSLARLVLGRFATGTAEAFDSVYTDPLGRRVMHAAVERKSVREGGPARVLAASGDRAVLLLTPTVRAARGRGISTGGEEMNQVRRLAGLYQALNTDGTWRLGRQLPFDSANFIRAQHIHVALDPGHETRIVDTLDVVVGTSYGLAVRLNNQARLDEVRLDGREVEHQLAGGVLWIAAPSRTHARLALRYTIAEEERASSDSAKGGARAPSFGMLENSDGWLPFFNYDSGNDFASLAVTATISAQYKLTTSVPQTEHVVGTVRTVHGESVHPQFILSLIYDTDWRSTTTRIGNLRFETLLTPRFRFSHDSLARLVAREYRLLTPRFGEPQRPSRYLVAVESRAVKGAGFTVRMNNAVVAGDNATRLDEPVLGPSAGFAHEVAHGWTMESSGPAANFLQEGWATYCESLVLGDLYGPAAAAAVWERLRTAYFGGQDRSGFQGGFEGRQSLLGDPDNGRIHYFKGSWIFHSLEYVLGDSVFDRGMRAFVEHAGYGPNGYEELIADLSKSAGRDVSSLVMPWLTEKYVPDVDAVVSGSSVIVTQSQPTRPFDLPLEVALTTSIGVVRRPVHLTTKSDTTDVSSLGVVTEARVDPDHHFLLRRHWGDTARFELRAPEAHVVELVGSFLAKPVAATRNGDIWTVELPLPEGRYVWLWRVDGSSPPDDVAVADAQRAAGDLGARAGVLTVRPVRHFPFADVR
jgi:hypothetical protein